MRISVLAVALAMAFVSSTVLAQATDYETMKASKLSAEAKAIEDGGVSEADYVRLLEIEVEGLALREMAPGKVLPGLDDALATARRAAVNYATERDTQEYVDRSQVQEAMGFSYEDLSGWWSYPDMDYANGCEDEDGQYRAALGRFERKDGTLAFGLGPMMLGHYDGGCDLSNERVENGSIVLDGKCSAEGEDYQGDVTVEVLANDEIRLTSPIMSATRLKACPGTLTASLPVVASQSSAAGMDLEKITPYFALYVVARECARVGHSFTEQDMANLDEVMKTISDGSTASRAEKEQMWAIMAAQVGGQRIPEDDCAATRQQMMFAFPAGTLVGSGEAFPF